MIEVKEYPWLEGSASASNFMPVGALMVPVETREAEPGCFGSARECVISCLFALHVALLVLLTMLVMHLLPQQILHAAQGGVPEHYALPQPWERLHFQSVSDHEKGSKRQGCGSGVCLFQWPVAVGSLP